MLPCPVCANPTQPAGSKLGVYVPGEYFFQHCPACRYTFVSNPVTDYARIYDENYYRGKGADPYLDYVNELERPDTSVRIHEWRALQQIVGSLVPLDARTAWLDFGCGNGGLVRHVTRHSGCQVEGFEEGWIAEHVRAQGIPMLTRADLARRQGGYDIVTAIEVLEHVPDPVACLREMRALLKPGGLLFLTTGNAQPRRNSLLKWHYVIPEIHVGYFEPQTLAQALTRAGFRPEFRPEPPGFSGILKFKILKTLGVRRLSPLEKLVPWKLVCRAAERRYRASAHPIGWAL